MTNNDSPILLLEQVNLLQAAVQVIPLVIPGVARVVDVFVGPRVRHDDISRVLLHIGKGVEYVGEFLGRDELRWVLATVDAPVTEQDVNSKP